jgi:SMODS and SLOG-associating 2TM effector domain family 4
LGPSILTPDSERRSLEAQLRECYGRVVYTHKTHEKMADLCNAALRRVKWGQILVSAVTASGAIGVVFYDAKALEIATAVFSLGSLILNGYAKDVNPGASAQRHREAAADIWNVRESYLSLLTDVSDPKIPTEDVRRRRDELQAKLHALYKAAPQTDDKAYGKAQEALKIKEDLTFSDEEIDRFLPGPLRRSTNSVSSLPNAQNTLS